MQTFAAVLKRLLIAAWAGCILFCLYLYFSNPAAFTPAAIAGFLRRFESELLTIYIGFSILRGFTLLPSTPLVIAGTLLYPDSPLAVLIISLGGIVLSSTMIYFFSEWLGFDDYFEKRHAKHVESLRQRLDRPAGVLFVFLWSMFPLAPTDAVCYVAGTIRMNFWKFIAAVFFGELIICWFYIYLGGHIVRTIG